MNIDGQITHAVNTRKLANTLDLITSVKERQIAVIDGLLPDELYKELRTEVDHLLVTEAKRRELVIQESGNTPRAYMSVGRDVIAKSSKIIPAIFNNDALREFLSDIVGEQLEKVPYEPEEFIVNSQAASGDTHGWHWDDYAYALIYVIDAPDPLLGGRVEFLPYVEWNKNDTEAYLRDVLSSNLTLSAYIRPGQCYLMKANTTLHRVTPLTGATKRSVIVFTFASPSDMVSDSITHNSMEAIYPESGIVAA